MNLFLDNISKESIGDNIKLTSTESLELGYEIASLENAIAKDVHDMSTGVDIVLSNSVDATIYATVLGIGQLSLEDKKGVLAKAWKAVKEFAVMVYNKIKKMFSSALKWFKSLFSKKDDSKEKQKLRDEITAEVLKSVADGKSDALNKLVDEKVKEATAKLKDDFDKQVKELKDLASKSVSESDFKSYKSDLHVKIYNIKASIKDIQSDLDENDEQFKKINNTLKEVNEMISDTASYDSVEVLQKQLDALINLTFPLKEDIDKQAEARKKKINDALNASLDKIKKYKKEIWALGYTLNGSWRIVSGIDDAIRENGERGGGYPIGLKAKKVKGVIQFENIDVDDGLDINDASDRYFTESIVTINRTMGEQSSRLLSNLETATEYIGSAYDTLKETNPELSPEAIDSAKIHTTKEVIRYLQEVTSGAMQLMKLEADIKRVVDALTSDRYGTKYDFKKYVNKK